MSKREKKPEVEFETPEVDFETPARGLDIEVPRKVAAPVDTFDPGFCWCGKKAPGCKGSPTRVLHLFGTHYQFVCPFGRDRTSVDKKVFEAARKASLVS